MQYHIDPFDRPHKVLWKDQHIKFSGVPYFVPGEKLLECQHGKDRNLEVIYQTRATVFHRDIQTPRRELKIRRAAEYF